MKKTILISGGSGLVGTFLQGKFQNAGHEVRILSRDRRLSSKSGVYHWDPDSNSFDMSALEGVDVIINLAGASIADQRWSDTRKKVLWESRIDSSRLLLEKVQESGLSLQCYIGASATGFYGDRGHEILTEESPAGEPSFLVELSQAWEEAHLAFEAVSQRVCRLRIGVVLTNRGGALPKLKSSVLFGIGAYLGRGDQYLPWIHIEDLASIFEKVIERSEIAGAINAVAPNPETNYQFIKILAKQSWGPGWLIPVPSFVLHILLGEMSSVLLYSQRVLPQRILEHKFDFQYPKLETALKALSEEK